MLVCLCQGVSDRQVRSAVRCGATSRTKVTAACGAGAGCGGCHEEIRQIIRKQGHATARVNAHCELEAHADASEVLVAAVPA